MEHKPIQFEVRSFDDVSAADCSPQQTVDGIEYAVKCPACNGRFTVEEVESIYRKVPFAKKAQPTSGVVNVVCECGEEHTGRPPADPFVGCGAAWRIRK